MVYYHLFVIHQRLNCAYFAIPIYFDMKCNKLSQIIANLGEICVFIFSCKGYFPLNSLDNYNIKLKIKTIFANQNGKRMKVNAVSINTEIICM